MDRTDWWVVVPALLLVSLGLLMQRSIAPGQLGYQLAFVAVSAVVFWVVARTDYQLFFSLHLPIYLGSLILLISPFILGVTSRGTHRWLQFGEVFLQPSEIAKPFLLVTFAVLATGGLKRRLGWLLLTWAVPSLVIFLQPDLGTMLVLTIGWLTVSLPLLPRRFLLLILAGLALVSPLLWQILQPYQRDRLLTFVNPYADPLGRGYQVIQSAIAVGSGQLWGRGLGQGTQSQLNFLPERHTDFMFASLAEELGFVGAATVLVLFGWLFLRLYQLAKSTPDLAANFFILAVLALLCFQVFINVGMNMGLAPVTGITLPFVSYGGSSLLSLAITLGLVVAISRRSRQSVL